MKRLLVIPMFAALAACETPQDIQGVQTYYDGNIVSIEGLQTREPTDAEQLNAEERCGGPATFEESVPVGDGYYKLTFRCD